MTTGDRKRICSSHRFSLSPPTLTTVELTESGFSFSAKILSYAIVCRSLVILGIAVVVVVVVVSTVRILFS